MTKVYSHIVAVPYVGCGRPSLPKHILYPDFQYVQVQKQRNEKGKIIEIKTEIIIGEAQKVKEVFENATCCKSINTDYVEMENIEKIMQDLRACLKIINFLLFKN